MVAQHYYLDNIALLKGEWW